MNNIVLVNQSGSKYLFSVPATIQLKEGDKVKCDTRRGITDGVCFTDSVIINTSALPLVCKLTGATLPLKEIVGKVVTSVEMFNKPVEEPTQPIAPQEDKAKFKVGQKVKVIGNCCRHGYSRGTILTLVRSVNFLRREPDWYVGEGAYYVSERDIEPYDEPEQPELTVTREMLVKFNACQNGIDLFDKHFPSGSGEYEKVCEIAKLYGERWRCANWLNTHKSEIVEMQNEPQMTNEEAISYLENAVCELDAGIKIYSGTIKEEFIEHRECFTVALSALHEQAERDKGCNGCVESGKWENEIEYGYPCPCIKCSRRCLDGYRPKEAQHE